MEHALRERFGSEETIVTLAEILSFLKTHQNSYGAAENPKKQQHSRASQQNAPPAKGQARDRACQGKATPGPYSSTAPPRIQGSQNATKPVQIPQAPRNQSQEPKQQPSYADVAKKAPEKAPQQPQKPRKASTLPESVKLAPKAPKPLKIVLREPIKDLPSELILKIKERAVNGDRLTSLIKAFRILTPKSLLVYATTEAAREELTQNTSWLDAIHASFYTRYYSIVIYRIRRDIPI